MNLLKRRNIMLAATQGSGGRLPKEYQEVKYIGSKSDKNEWLDTGFIASNYSSYSYEIEFLITIENNVSIIGAVNTRNNAFGQTYIGSATGRNIELWIGARWENFDSVHYTGQDIIRRCVDVTQNSVSLVDYVNEQIVNQKSGALQTTPFVDIPAYLFSYNSNGTATQRAVVNFYNSVKLYGDNNLVTELVPCYRKSDGVRGMYDIVQGIFRTNLGTGEFIVGPDV